MGVTVGRVFREADLGQFGPGSGLDGRTSDWLAAVNFDLADGLCADRRGRCWTMTLSLTKGEARMALTAGRSTSVADIADLGGGRSAGKPARSDAGSDLRRPPQD